MTASTIIVGYDGRKTSDDAVALASQLARLTNAKLVLAFAYDAEIASPPAASGELVVSAEEAAKSVLREGLKAIPYGIPASQRAIPDAPAARVLEELAKREHADLIVIGTTEFGPVSRILIGSVGQRLLHSAPCCVAVAPKDFARQHPTSLNKIGVCWDGSSEARDALELAIQLAKKTQAEVRLYTVINPPPRAAYPTYPSVYLPDAEPIRRIVELALADACQRIPSDIAAGSVVFEGHPASTLAKQAANDQTDLLLLGSRGYGPVLRVLLGGVSDALMRTAPCPVLIVPSSAAELARAA
jgi:nucleotide-binding universal stress UspA family protein